MTNIIEISDSFLTNSEIGKSTLTIPVTFTPVEAGIRSAVLVVEGNMTAGDLEIQLTGIADQDPIHANAIERRMPTGAAWHDGSFRAIYKGLAFEIARVVDTIRDRASILNTLFGFNLENWIRFLGLSSSGTTEEKELSITRKLSDIGGLRAADMTRELQAAGFPLTVYPNKWKQTPDPYTYGGSYYGSSTFSTTKRYNWRDLRYLKDIIPSDTYGSESAYFGAVTYGLSRSDAGAELIVNSLDPADDDPLWSNLDSDRQRWHYGFVISGDTIFDIKTISEERRTELRRLILEIKPLGMWAFLICNYE